MNATEAIIELQQNHEQQGTWAYGMEYTESCDWSV